MRRLRSCGDRLNISRAAISDLEMRISLRLCQRGRSGFALTEEGKEAYESSLQLLAAVEGFRTRVNSLHGWLKGELNIGITDNLVTMPEMHITNALSALKERGSDIRPARHDGESSLIHARKAHNFSV